jgi:branched-chain amino acid transport system ATP-binding protein
MSTWRAIFAWGDLRKTPYGIRPVAVFAAIGLFSGLGSEFFVVAGPNIAQDLNLDLKTIGGVFSIVSTLGLASAFFIGWLSDRVKRLWLGAGGIILAGAAQMSLSAANGTGSYASAQVGGTIGSLSARVPNLALIADYYPTDARGRVYAIEGAISEATKILSLLIVGVLITVLDWRTTNIILTAPVFFLGIVMLVFLREPKRGYFEKRALGMKHEAAAREDRPQSFGEAWRTMWSVRMVRRMFVASIFSGMAGAPVRVFFPFFLAEHYGLSAGERALYAFPILIAVLVGGVIGGGLIDVLGKRSPSSVLRVLGAFNGLPIIGLIMYALQPPILVLVVGSCLLNFAEGAVRPAFLSVFSQVMPAKIRGQGLSLFSISSLPGSITTGLIFGAVATAYGFRPLFLMGIPLYIVMTFLMVSVADFYEVDRRNALIATAADEEARRARAEGRTKLLICRGVNVFYEQNQVLFGVDFEVEEGEIVALLGTNGAGKSTLLRAISGSQEAADGVVVLDGRNITHMPPHEVAALGVVHMPGGRGVFPGLSVEENLKLATWLDASSAARSLEEAYELFPVLHARRGQRAELLSGGEQQMLSLAQAFMAKPKLLMIDELTLGLSPAVVGELIKLVREINRRGTTVIVVEQSVNVALTIAKRAVFMEKGEVRFVGRTSDLLRRPDILRAVYVKGTGTRVAPPRRGDVDEAEGRVVLDVQQIEKHFGGVAALDRVDLQLREHEILGLIGPNGSGKTTLFDIISGYQPADAGRVIFEGTDITELSAHERARLGLVRRFQDARLFPSLTVMESLLVALDQGLEQKNLAVATTRLPVMRRDERRARAKAESLIALLDLGAYREKFIKELSTGLRRIVDIAWVLATEPKVLLLDEPSSGVAQAEAESLVPLLRRVRAETGCSILLVEHDIPLVSALADELVAMAAGEVVTRGPAIDVLDDDRVIEAFLGTSEAAVRRSGALT